MDKADIERINRLFMMYGSHELPICDVEEKEDCDRIEPRHSAYYEEQRMLREQAREGLCDAFELDYYDDGGEYDEFDWRD